jgi:hypothetical protein
MSTIRMCLDAGHFQIKIFPIFGSRPASVSVLFGTMENVGCEKFPALAESHMPAGIQMNGMDESQ